MCEISGVINLELSESKLNTSAQLAFQTFVCQCMWNELLTARNKHDMSLYMQHINDVFLF